MRVEGPGGGLEALRRAETALQVAPPIAASSEAARARHGDAVAAVIFYGSCLRIGSDEGKVVDLYIVVDGYRAAYGSGLRALFNPVLPPKLFYIHTRFHGPRARPPDSGVSRPPFAPSARGR